MPGQEFGKIVKKLHNSQDGHQMITSCEFHAYSTIFEWYIEFGDSSVKIAIFGNFQSQFSQKKSARVKLKVLFSTNFRRKQKKSLEPFLKKI